MQTKYFPTKIKMLLFLLIFGSTAHAQIEKIDSLEKVLLGAKDTARVDALNELAYSIYYN